MLKMATDSLYIYTYMYVLYIYMYMCIYMYVCMYVYMCVYISNESVAFWALVLVLVLVLYIVIAFSSADFHSEKHHWVPLWAVPLWAVQFWAFPELSFEAWIHFHGNTLKTHWGGSRPGLGPWRRGPWTRTCWAMRQWECIWLLWWATWSMETQCGSCGLWGPFVKQQKIKI